MLTVFPWLHKFTSMPFGYVCVHISRGQKLLHIYVLTLYAAWFRNYLQSISVNNIIREVDFYRHMHNVAGCQVLFQIVG